MTENLYANPCFRLLPAVALAALAGCSDPRPAPKAATVVRTVTVAPTPRSVSVTLTGEIKAHVQSDLAFRLAGRIAKRVVEVGDHVIAGQVLATLETVEQTADLNSAKAGVEAADATLKQATSTFDRQKELLAKGFTTRTKYDDAEKAFITSQAALDGAKATLATAEEKLEQTILRADSPGIVTSRNAEAGQVVEAAQTVFAVAGDGGRDAVFDVYEALLATKPAEGAIEISMLSNPKIRTTGRVREISPVIDPATGTVRVKIGLIDAPAAMVLGAAVAGVGKFQPRDMFALPWTAFFTQSGKPAVWVVDPRNKTVFTKPVVISSYRTGEMLISGGLNAGDVVVTAGVQMLRPGEVVSPQEVTALVKAEEARP